jgi:hypothetical protein
MSTDQNRVAFVAEGIQKVQGSSVGSRTTDTCKDPKRAPCCALTALAARTAASSANAKVTRRLDPSEREHVGTGAHGARLMQSSSLRSQREPSRSAHPSSSDALYAQKRQHALLPVGRTGALTVVIKTAAPIAITHDSARSTCPRIIPYVLRILLITVW